jgi:hypothetical protein
VNNVKTNTVIKVTHLLSFMCCLSLVSCVTDVSHDNPYDPLSPSYTGTGGIVGKVTMLNISTTTLVGVTVSIPSTGDFTQTDSSGSFSFPKIAEGKAILVFSKTGYVPDTVICAVSLGQTMTVNVAMNALPVISGASIVTHKIDQWSTGADYYANVYATVIDPNGLAEIDSVWFVDEEDEIPMSYNITDKRYEVRIDSSTLSMGYLEWLVGRPLTIYAKDQHGAITQSSTFYVSRIIQDEPTPVFPTSGDTVTFPFQMNWAAPNVSFDYNYIIDVVRVQGITQTLVKEFPSILPNVLVQTLDKNSPIQFSSGIYFWTVSVIDEKLNTARSKEAYFVVP